MNNKIIIISLICIFLIYINQIINEGNKIVKFVTSYYLLEKNKNFISDKLNSCLFSTVIMKNGVELSCAPLKQYCNNSKPHNIDLINENTACSVLTIDINTFQKKPNRISSNKEIKDQYKLLSYSDGVVTVPNSIENNILYNKKKTFKRRIQSILLFLEVRKHSKLFY